MPPDAVFLIAWPLLKLAALRADLRIGRIPAARRGPLVALRIVDWGLFFAFPRLAPRSGSASFVALLTFGQLAATSEAARRGRRVDPSIGRLLLPQVAWLAYAVAVPLALSRRQSH